MNSERVVVWIRRRAVASMCMRIYAYCRMVADHRCVINKSCVRAHGGFAVCCECVCIVECHHNGWVQNGRCQRQSIASAKVPSRTGEELVQSSCPFTIIINNETSFYFSLFFSSVIYESFTIYGWCFYVRSVELGQLHASGELGDMWGNCAKTISITYTARRRVFDFFYV